MILNSNTHAVAQTEDGEVYIISNNLNVDYDHMDILKDRGCSVNSFTKKISPELPIGVLTKMENFVKPTIKVDIEELKTYKQLK